MEGFERGRNLDKIGLKAQDTAELFFDDVQVPAENLLGERGQGFIYLMQNLPQERLVDRRRWRAAADGTVLEHTLEYTKERKAFGKPIGSFQNTRFVLAELATEATIARIVRRRVHRAAPRRASSRRRRRDGEVVDDRDADKLVDRCLQLHGGYGYMREYPIAQAYRRRARADDLRRHERDHEGDHRPQPRRLAI